MRSATNALRLGPEQPSAASGLLASAAAVAVGTLLVYPLKDAAPAVSLGVVYIPGVLLISTVWGWRLGVLAGGCRARWPSTGSTSRRPAASTSPPTATPSPSSYS